MHVTTMGLFFDQYISSFELSPVAEQILNDDET